MVANQRAASRAPSCRICNAWRRCTPTSTAPRRTRGQRSTRSMGRRPPCSCSMLPARSFTRAPTSAPRGRRAEPLAETDCVLQRPSFPRSSGRFSPARPARTVHQGSPARCTCAAHPASRTSSSWLSQPDPARWVRTLGARPSFSRSRTRSPKRRRIRPSSPTRSEAILAADLLRGLSVVEAAVKRGRSVATMRTHLASVLAKTATLSSKMTRFRLRTARGHFSDPEI
jgi:hypothetical protein